MRTITTLVERAPKGLSGLHLPVSDTFSASGMLSPYFQTKDTRRVGTGRDTKVILQNMKIVIASVDTYDPQNNVCSVSFGQFDGVNPMTFNQVQISLIGVFDNEDFIDAIVAGVASSISGTTKEDIIWGNFNLLSPFDLESMKGYTSATIDGKTVGNTTIFTNNSGKDFLVTEYWIHPITVTGLGTAPIINIGKTASAYSDIDATVSLAFASQSGKFSPRTPSNNSVVVANGESLVCRVATAAILTTTYNFQVIARGVYL